MPASTISISVIVPAHNCESTLPLLLDALAIQKGSEAFEVVICDDRSVIPVEQTVDRWFSKSPGSRAFSGVKIVKILAAEPGGPGAARDRAIAAASGDILAFTDADCVPAEDWLAHITWPLLSDDARLKLKLGIATVAQGPIVPTADSQKIGPFDRVVGRSGFSPLFETANLATYRSAVLEAGGFSAGVKPKRGKELAEDTCLGQQLLLLGAKPRYVPDAIVNHPIDHRGWLAAARERTRLAAFPGLVSKFPGLRDDLLTNRLFISQASQSLVMLTASSALALAIPARRKQGGFALAAAVAGSTPYALNLSRRVYDEAGNRSLGTAFGQVACDVTGLAATIYGSLKQQTVVL